MIIFRFYILSKSTK